MSDSSAVSSSLSLLKWIPVRAGSNWVNIAGPEDRLQARRKIMTATPQKRGTLHSISWILRGDITTSKFGVIIDFGSRKRQQFIGSLLEIRERILIKIALFPPS